MSDQRATEQEKADLWRARFSAMRASGKSVREWCSESGIPESRYYYWQRALRKRDGFISLKSAPVSSELRITWPDGMALCISDQMPAPVVAELVHCLRGDQSC